jgi:hypothetical protein
MTDQMEVDIPTPAISGGLSPSSSFEKLDLAKIDLDELNESMKNRCNKQGWGLRIEWAKHDASQWQELILNVFTSLMKALMATDAKSSVIAEPTFTDAEVFVAGFNEKEFEEWKVGVRRGVETNDWTDLMMHRTYISHYRMLESRLIATTAKIRKRKVPKVALGVPIVKTKKS